MSYAGTSPLAPRALSARLLPAPHSLLLASLGTKPKEGTSYGLVTCDRDPPLRVALDEATKASPVTVLMVRAYYGGVPGAPDPLSGEVMGILVGSDDEIVREGLKSAIRALSDSAHFYLTDRGARRLPFFAHVIPSLGNYLSKEAGLRPTETMAYLMSSPLESIFALDAALKAADVKLVKHFSEPTPTNLGGAFLTGPLEECQAAAEAFASAIVSIAERPLDRFETGYVRSK